MRRLHLFIDVFFWLVTIIIILFFFCCIFQIFGVRKGRQKRLFSFEFVSLVVDVSKCTLHLKIHGIRCYGIFIERRRNTLRCISKWSFCLDFTFFFILLKYDIVKLFMLKMNRSEWSTTARVKEAIKVPNETVFNRENV